MGGKKPKPDPGLLKAQRQEEARLAAEKAALEEEEAQTTRARRAGLRGTRSLIGTGSLGAPLAG